LTSERGEKNEVPKLGDFAGKNIPVILKLPGRNPWFYG
jgi:hypothetical protein